MKSPVSRLLPLMLLVSNLVAAQNIDVEKATLQYNLASPQAVSTSNDVSGQTVNAGTATESATTQQPELLQAILGKIGKKERKIVQKVLDVGVENNLINLQKLEKKLGQINVPAIMGLYQDLRSVKISGIDLKKIENIRTTLINIDAAIKKADLKAPEFGKLSFFAGMARDQLANVAADPAQRSELRAVAMQNYSDTISSLANDKTPASQGKVADSAERLETLRNPFGTIVPVAPKTGKSEPLITSDYGTRTHPVKKTKRFHSGVDLAGWKCNGWKVLAIGSGRVIKSGWESGYGYSIVVSHDIEGRQYFSRYAHLMKKNRLTVGKLVKTGDLLGYCNNSGISTGAHLHFEVREGSASGQTHDPKNYLPEVGTL